MENGRNSSWEKILTDDEACQVSTLLYTELSGSNIEIMIMHLFVFYNNLGSVKINFILQRSIKLIMTIKEYLYNVAKYLHFK